MRRNNWIKKISRACAESDEGSLTVYLQKARITEKKTIETKNHAICSVVVSLLKSLDTATVSLQNTLHMW